MTFSHADPAYNTVARDDFAAMIDVERYAQRTPHFDEIIARTEEHFWNPDDPDYIRWDAPWAADDIADEGIAYLKTVNASKYKVVKKLSA